MLVKLFGKRAHEAVVVLDTWRENSVQANVRHHTAQAAAKVKHLGGHRGVGNPFLNLSAVRCDREEYGVDFSFFLIHSTPYVSLCTKVIGDLVAVLVGPGVLRNIIYIYGY